MTRPAPPEIPSDTVLDADIVALLDEAIVPEVIDPATQARIKSRLLRRIANDSVPRHLTVQPDEGSWKPLPGGLAIKVLHREGAVMSYLVRMAPGSALPAHRHPIDEECIVLEGAVQIGEQNVGAGGFHLGRQDVLHDVIQSPGGALLFLRGAVPHEGLLL